MTLTQIANLTDLREGDTVEIETATGTVTRVVSFVGGTAVYTASTSKAHKFAAGILRCDHDGLTWKANSNSPVLPVVALWRSV